MVRQLILNDEGLNKVIGSSDLSCVHAVVEATSFEVLALFMENSVEGVRERIRRYQGDRAVKTLGVPSYCWNWEERFNWSTVTIGHSFGDQSIAIDLKFVTLSKPGGKQTPKGILFYNDESGVIVDRLLIKDWLTHWFPRHMRTPHLHTNATNFGNVLND